MLNKNVFILTLCAFFIAQPLFAQEKEDDGKEKNQKLEIKPYGFIKGDMVYATAGVKSFAFDGSLGAPQQATGVEESAMGFTAQHTRLGLKGSVGEKVKVGGVVEIDFFTNSFITNANPRLRLGYASITHGGFEVRMGQQWDLFSPLNPNTNNTNGNLWFAGNKGFRRAQMLFMYTLANETFAPTVQLSFGETTPDGTFPGKDNLSGMPMTQARLSGLYDKKYSFGVSFVYGKHLEKGTTVLLQDYDFKFATSGIGVDVTLPLHKYLSIAGEFNMGTNLHNASLFSIADMHSFTVDALSNEVVQYDKKSMGFWVNATSNVTDWLTTVLGYGSDQNKTPDLATGALKSNTLIYAHLIFPIKHGFAAAVEWQNIKTTVVDGDDRKANVLGVSAKVTF